MASSATSAPTSWAQVAARSLSVANTHCAGEMQQALSPVSLPTGAVEVAQENAQGSADNILANQVAAVNFIASFSLSLSPSSSSASLKSATPLLSSNARPAEKAAPSREDGEKEEEEEEWEVVGKTGKWRFCVWGLGILPKATFFSLLSSAFTGSLINNVKKVKLVSQEDGQVRYDIYTQHPSFELMEACVRKVVPFAQAHVRRHVPFHLRSRPCVAARSPSTLRVVTLNIDGLVKAKEDVMLMLEKECVDIALFQETCRTAHEVASRSVFLSGYNVSEMAMEAVAGRARGLAVAVRNGLQARTLAWASSPHCLAVEVRLSQNVLIVLSGYVCHGATREAVNAIQHATSQIRLRRPNALVLLGADFNKEAATTAGAKRLAQFGLSRVPFAGSDKTHIVNFKPVSAIDYFAANNAALSLSAKCYVERGWDLSDHKVVVARLHVGEVAQENVRERVPKLDMKALENKKSAILGSNRWAALLDMTENIESVEEVDKVVSSLLKVSREIATEEKCLKGKGKDRARQFSLSRKTISAVDKRRHFAASLLSSPQVTVDERKQYDELRKEAKKLVREDKAKGWNNFVTHAVKSRRDNSAAYWNWIKKVSHIRGAAGKTGRGLPPVVPLGGAAPVYEEPKIVEAMSEYYELLNKDAEPKVSQNKAHWEKAHKNLRQLSTLDVNGPITWTEVNGALRRCHPTKAAGPSGIQNGWWQLAMEEAASVEPSTALGKIMLRALSAMWMHSRVPLELRVSLLVSILKKGDSTNMENYRGIALCETLLKILSSILAERLQNALTTSGRIAFEQAGFRSREECNGQVLSLLEMINLRATVTEDPVYVCFLDMKKAFDTVPFYSMLVKLERMGVNGRALAFVEALYTNSQVAVRRADGSAGPSIDVERGVRQGCPLSPILFNVFINDLVKVCMPGELIPHSNGRFLPALLYADDVAIVASNIDTLKSTLDRVGQWAAKNRMTFGIDKCGVMVFNGSMKELRNSKVTLCGQLVPVVVRYVYLGFPITFTSSNKYSEVVDAAVPVRKSAGERVVGACSAFLNNRTIPLAAKVDTMRAMIFPVLTYGGEILGLSETRVASLDAVWKQCVRDVVNGFGFCAAPILMRELGFKHVFSVMSAMRARAFLKYPTLSTPASLFCSRKIQGARWVSNTLAGLKRLGVEKVAATELVEAVQNAAEKKMWDDYKVDCTNARAYDVKGFNETAGYLSYYFNKMVERLDVGMIMLMAARCNGLWTGYKAAQAKLVDEKYAQECPNCHRIIKTVPYAHIFLDCPSWDAQRAEHLAAVFDSFPDDFVGDSSNLKTVLLLGGKTPSRPALDGWVCAADDDDAEPLFVPVTRFLQSSISNELRGAIWQHSTAKSRRPNGYGSPVGGAG